MRIPRFAAALLLALPLASVADAAAPPTPFSADYEVLQDGKPLGTGQISLRRRPDGRWEMTTRSEATSGLAAAAGVRRTEVSVIDWSGDRPRTLGYDMQQQAAWNKRRETLAVDPAARTARVTYKGATQALPYQDGLLDRHAVTAALMSELAAGRRGDMAFPVAGRRDVATDRYRTAANVRLRTALGVERAIRVERVRDDDSGRVTKIWFARNRGWLPLRIKQYEADGSTLDLRITAVR
ncbi:MAG TPA: DUF3108 domain-containing protein [Arenimonas sp.]|uniref:DUF3108 domain-containing protein n=1 Tax=Arenimonas sp. TaxID=1872635 RepID=UPI002D80B62B|nr:DUF3108 domain-containing protein [Arenimonas sp.]HEU0152033.1 DUF3108 domain-containing protein [Arenimonas sp.]